MNSKLTYLEVQTSVIRTENTKIKLVKIGQTQIPQLKKCCNHIALLAETVKKRGVILN